MDRTARGVDKAFNPVRARRFEQVVHAADVDGKTRAVIAIRCVGCHDGVNDCVTPFHRCADRVVVEHIPNNCIVTSFNQANVKRRHLVTHAQEIQRNAPDKARRTR